MCFKPGTLERAYLEFKNLSLKEQIAYVVNIFLLISFVSLIAGFFIVYFYLNAEKIPFYAFSGNESLPFLILFVIIFIAVIIPFSLSLYYHSSLMKGNNIAINTITSIIYILPYLILTYSLYLLLPISLLTSENEVIFFLIAIPSIIFIYFITGLFPLKKIKKHTKNEWIFWVCFIIAIIVSFFLITYGINVKYSKWIALSSSISILLLNLRLTIFHTKNAKTKSRLFLIILLIVSLIIFFIIVFNPSPAKNKYFKKYQEIRKNILGIPFRFLDEGGNIFLRFKINKKYYKYLKNKYINSKACNICDNIGYNNNIFARLILKANNGYYINLYCYQYQKNAGKNNISQNTKTPASHIILKEVNTASMFIKNRYVEQTYVSPSLLYIKIDKTNANKKIKKTKRAG